MFQEAPAQLAAAISSNYALAFLFGTWVLVGLPMLTQRIMSEIFEKLIDELTTVVVIMLASFIVWLLTQLP